MLLHVRHAQDQQQEAHCGADQDHAHNPPDRAQHELTTTAQHHHIVNEQTGGR